MPAHIITRRARLAAFAAQAAKPGGGPLEVTELRLFPLREPVSKRRYTVVKVETRSGVPGFGECGAVTAAELEAGRTAVVGRPATAVEPVRRALAAWPGLQAAVNMALLDAAGRQAKAPVYQMLGGPTRNKARALMPLAGSTDAELAADAKRGRAAGYRAFLVPVPSGADSRPGHVAATRTRLETVRSAADGCDFVLDGGGRLQAGEAADLAADLERFRLLWFDEPCAISNLATIRKISGETVTPLGFGRDLTDGSPFQDLLREDAIDILRPTLGANGISQIRRIAVLAETYYVAVAPFHDGGPVGTAAALHLAASLPNFFIQQIPLPAAEQDRQMRAEIAPGAERIQDGFAALPVGPGLGIQVNESALAKYQEKQS